MCNDYIDVVKLPDFTFLHLFDFMWRNRRAQDGNTRQQKINDFVNIVKCIIDTGSRNTPLASILKYFCTAIILVCF